MSWGTSVGRPRCRKIRCTMAASSMSDQPQPPAAPRTRQHIKWDQQFPQRKASHCVFPSEKVGFSGNHEIPEVPWTLARGAGCRAGVANKSSQKVNAFLDEVFDDVFAREAS